MMDHSLLKNIISSIPYTQKSFYISEIVDTQHNNFGFFTKVTPLNHFFSENDFIAEYSIEFLAQTCICNSFKNSTNRSENYYLSSIDHADFFDLRVKKNEIDYFKCVLSEFRTIDRFILASGICSARLSNDELTVAAISLVLSTDI